MAKAANKKSAKEASNLFHNIMAASVKGNPAPNNPSSKNNTMKTVVVHFNKKPLVVPYEISTTDKGYLHIIAYTNSPQLSKYFTENIVATLLQSDNVLNTIAFANEDAQRIKQLVINEIFRANDVDFVY